MNLIVCDGDSDKVNLFGSPTKIIDNIDEEITFLKEIRDVLSTLANIGFQQETIIVKPEVVTSSFITEHVTSVTIMEEWVEEEEVQRILKLQPDDVIFFTYKNDKMTEI